jgi:uncharacterized protein (DUF362 family)
MRDRREFLKAALAASLAPGLVRCAQPEPLPDQPWTDDAFRKTDRSAVAILPASEYDGRLVDIVRRGIAMFGIDVSGKRVALKPNFVEFDPNSAINTSPVLIAAAIEAFRSLGAASVTVAEGPGHRRDNEYVLRASGLLDTLRDAKASYVDLNIDRVQPVEAGGRFSNLGRLYIGETVTNADLLISMPKMKTHHWAGVTLSLKNMFGIMPGAIYGWPKNVLHFAGIEPSILDINAALRVPRFNIVDGIVGMEGNGPIQGTARKSGVLVFGADPVAVDSTAARLMGIEPRNIWYLAQADRFLGNLADDRIEQRGESLEAFAQEYQLIEPMRRLRPRLTGSG